MQKSPLFNKKQLINLYITQKLSTGSIAKISKCNHVTVLNYLKLFDIPRRSKLGTRKGVEVSKQKLIELYHNKGMTQKEIAKLLGHSRYGIQRWMKTYGVKRKTFYETHKVYPKHNFSENLTEKAYLIGFRLGDLNVYKIRNLIQARCSTTIEAQVNLIDVLFKKYGNVHIWKARRGTFEIITLLNHSFDFLLEKNDRIPQWISSNDRYFLSFIAGYSDAEGSFFLRKPSKIANYEWGMYELQTCDKSIIFTIKDYLVRKGIKCKLYNSRKAGYTDKRGVKTNKDCWRISISQKQSLWNFIKIIEKYHKHEQKLRDLKRVRKNILMRDTIPYGRRITF